MDRASAIERVRKLRALADPNRGGTPAERAVAARKAEELSARFGLGAVETQPQSPQAAPRRGQRGFRIWTASPFGEIFVDFDPRTGEHGENVEVHHHHGPANWKLTIHDDRIGKPPISHRNLGDGPKRLKGK